MSIFGQVWLWSLLAFVVGAVLAWLVLARPARKRVSELETELASAHADTARAAASTPARTAVLPPAEDWTRDRREHAPTEVIQATSAFEPEAEYDAEYRTAPEPAAAADSSKPSDDDVDEAFAQAEAREHQAANGLFDSAPAESAPEESGSAYRTAATEYLQPADTGSHRIAEPAEDHDSGYHRVAEPADEHDSGYHRRPEPADVPEADRAEPVRPAEEEPGRHVAEPADGLSSLERRLDPAPLDSAASKSEPVSLFRPGPGRATEPEPDWFSQPGTAQRSPFEEPAEPAESSVGHLEEESTTDHLIPSPEPAAAPSTEDVPESSQGLPKRQRREAPRGGFDPPRPIQPSMRPVERREPDLAGGHSGSLFEPSVQPNQAAMAAPEPPPARQTADDAVPPGPFGPGSAMPRPGGGRPAEGFSVKASVTALRYCTEDSPQFPKMVAEVWFRSAADAERVGFRPLH
ncbi:LapA family protein [Amycolatopsis orientalis]|uniref:LapA family protein n=1 Tax=Amycolatopsis orientalis TaxID=31958 RepID=UPI00039A9CB0|nr:LapA family protein [Amycolatopsis orientalis]